MIKAINLHKSFENNDVLRDINLEIDRGDSLAIVGGSGAGKSVLIKCMLGLLKPDQGHVTVDGAQKINMDRVGVLFQGGALFDSLRIWENVSFRPMQQHMPKAKARDLAIEKLDRVGLSPEVADMFPAELSGGMQKRAGLARAIVGDPDILFFDEPTTGLDPIKGARINRLIRDIVAETRATAITITHDMTTVQTVASRTAMIFDGCIHWVGPTSDFFASIDPVLVQFTTGAADGPHEPQRNT